MPAMDDHHLDYIKEFLKKKLLLSLITLRIIKKTHQILLLYNYWEGQSKYWLLTRTNKQTTVHPSSARSPLATSGKRTSMLTSNNIWYTTYGMCIHIYTHTSKVSTSKTAIGIAKLERTKTRWKKNVCSFAVRKKRQTDKQTIKEDATHYPQYNTSIQCGSRQSWKS
jgi:hypothetical protein